MSAVVELIVAGIGGKKIEGQEDLFPEIFLPLNLLA